MRRSSSSRSCCWYARRDAHVADPAGRRAGSSSAMTRFMNSAYRASASARWQTTSSVDQRPGTGLARTYSAVIPATASRTSCGPDKYSRTSCAWYTVLPFPFTPGLGPCRHTSRRCCNGIGDSDNGRQAGSWAGRTPGKAIYPGLRLIASVWL